MDLKAHDVRVLRAQVAMFSRRRMSKYLHVQNSFPDQLAFLGWKVIDQSRGFIPTDPSISLRTSFREWILPDVFRTAVRALNRTQHDPLCLKNGWFCLQRKCMMAPATIIDYLIVHELCHFRYSDHTDGLWNEVDKVIPKYYERKEWLKRNGAVMDCEVQGLLLSMQRAY
jgi:hypothetical protein